LGPEGGGKPPARGSSVVRDQPPAEN
jgi:hypothetical protein